VVPDRIEVRITERVPFALWRLGERSFLIDATGRVLAPMAADKMPELPRIAGEGAATEAAALFARVAAYPDLAPKVELAERVGSRRWVLRLTGGVVIHLPARGEAEALAWLAPLARTGFARVAEIDLRAARRAVVRERPETSVPADRAAQAAPPAAPI
jgi:cell division protein FtsQ